MNPVPNGRKTIVRRSEMRGTLGQLQQFMKIRARCSALLHRYSRCDSLLTASAP